MKRFLIFLNFVFFTLLIHSTLTTKISAVTFEYPEYNVNIVVNKNSSFNVQEEVIYNVYGEFHGLRRDLTLADQSRDRLCSSAENIYCGGFDRVVVNFVKDLDGKDITNKVKLYRVSDEETNKEFLRFEWEIFPNGEYQDGDTFGWILNYTVYGGIVEAEGLPYFYWNILPEEKNGTVDRSKITIQLPDNSIINKSKLQIYTDLKYNLVSESNSINLTLNNIPSYAPFTVAYGFDSSEIELPGEISYSLAPMFGTQVFLNDIDITDQVDGIIRSVPTGLNSVRFEHIGYEPFTKTIDVKSGQTEIIEVNLTPMPIMQFLLLLNNLVCLCGCLFIPIGLIAVYFYYLKRGKDKDMPKTIIPLFKPPTGTKPYLVGSLIDERVDKQDIVGSIIDMAYRGYLKIKEIEKNKNYQLIKMSGNTEDEGLNSLEEKIYNSLFKSGESVETKDLGLTFPYDYITIESSIYKEMVSNGYFTKSPRTTIGIYLTLGIFLVIVGIISLISITLLLIYLLGILTIFTPSLVILFIGTAFVVVAKFMPAKTSKGSKLYADILGFKMYMNTAERYTVQKLEPEDFVKYLSYAIVFGIEKEWANRFKDIYKGVPDWYEGTGNIYDALWISSFARNFSNSTVQSMTPITTSSTSGSGWSGSGSFGGFSGGGGGGGSSGGW